MFHYGEPLSQVSDTQNQLQRSVTLASVQLLMDHTHPLITTLNPFFTSILSLPHTVHITPSSLLDHIHHNYEVYCGLEVKKGLSMVMSHEYNCKIQTSQEAPVHVKECEANYIKMFRLNPIIEACSKNGKKQFDQGGAWSLFHNSGKANKHIRRV